MINFKIKSITFKNGLTYSEYKKLFVTDIERTDADILNDLEKKKHEARIINLHRTNRLEKTYFPSEQTLEVLNQINFKQKWMILSENWCGDSAQNIPIIQKIASLNHNIELRFFLRDSNTEIMDIYLTNGKRSIPKLIAFDEMGIELFQWGPRPKSANDIVQKLRDENIDKDEMNKHLHFWYAKNKGQEIEAELIGLLKNVNALLT